MKVKKFSENWRDPHQTVELGKGLNPIPFSIVNVIEFKGFSYRGASLSSYAKEENIRCRLFRNLK